MYSPNRAILIGPPHNVSGTAGTFHPRFWISIFISTSSSFNSRSSSHPCLPSMDLLSVLPNFSIKSYTHILPPLERARVNTVDLISLDTLEIARRAHVPPADVRRLANHVIKALHHDVGFEEAPRPEDEQPDSSLDPDVPLIPGPRTKLDLSQWCTISTLDSTLDTLLNGGIPTGYVTEVTGERYISV